MRFDSSAVHSDNPLWRDKVFSFCRWFGDQSIIAGNLSRYLFPSIQKPTHESTREGARAATFDTRLTWGFLERWGGFAAPKMADVLKEKGWTPAGEPGGFFVKGLKRGPLKRGEADRAAAWARSIVEGLS